MSTVNADFNTRTIGSFKDYNFFIDKYQRGYKWTSQQVLDLLNDIDGFKKSEEAFYCLQPLAVKQLDKEKRSKYFTDNLEQSYEVIDGQQRLTTVFLILKLIDNDLYNIQYQTRERSAEFLKSITEKITEENYYYCDSVSAINRAIENNWKAFVETNKEENNIDNYHFFGAHYTIKSWFYNKDEEFKSLFINKLLNDTRFIWYQDTSKDDSKKVFRNLNSGKIGLTNSELIKALFINSFKSNDIEVTDLMQTAFANEWDQIEQNLQKDDFWFFINNSTDANNYETRIDFLFELIVGKPENSDDKLYTYRKFANDDTLLNWKDVKNYYLKILEWYNDAELYHLIGFIIDRGFEKIKSIITLSLQKTEGKVLNKKEFRNEIYNIIRTKVSKYYIDSINYKDNYEEIKTILLLFNIEHYLCNINGVRFPFKDFKNTKWTLEHIHAQNSDDIETVEELEAWVNGIRQYKEHLIKLIDINPEEKNLNEKLKSFNESEVEKKIQELKIDELKQSKNKEEVKTVIREFLEETSSFVDEFLDVHLLGNMALLDGSTNSGLGKKPFPQKRDYLVEITKRDLREIKEDGDVKPYIPPTTLNVFFKYYTKGEKSYELWGYQDRKDYIAEIKRVLNPYFEKEENHHD